VSDYNRAIIEEFRASGGRVGGRYEGRPLVLLTTTGARTGERPTTPLVCLPDGGRLIVFASASGAPRSPGWYHNLRANPVATVEVGTETYEVDATEVTGPERDRLFARQVEVWPGLADYQRRTSRRFPVVALSRRAATQS